MANDTTHKTKIRQVFSDEFKREAVKLVTEQGYSIQKAADSLDIRANYLSRWIKKFKATQARNPEEETVHEELLRLRKENSRLKMEKEILKKASAFFASEMK